MNALFNSRRRFESECMCPAADELACVVGLSDRSTQRGRSSGQILRAGPLKNVSTFCIFFNPTPKLAGWLFSTQPRVPLAHKSPRNDSLSLSPSLAAGHAFGCSSVVRSVLVDACFGLDSQAVKTIQVWSLPEVLILHFKRFSHA